MYIVLNKIIPSVLSALFFASCAYADVLKCVDESGKIIYSNNGAVSGECQPLGDRGAVSVLPATPGTQQPSPSTGSDGTIKLKATSGIPGVPTPTDLQRYKQELEQSTEQRLQTIPAP